jgi:zinc protease
MSTDLETGLRLVADVLLNPTFPSETLEREREIQLANLQAQKDHLLKCASVAMRRTLFGDRSYGLDPLGTETSIPQIQVADLKTFHQSVAVPNNCVLAIFGDVKTAEIKSAVEKAFAMWKSATLPEAPRSGISAPGSAKRSEEIRDKKQAVIVIGFPATTLRSDDRYALDLLQETCSDLGSRLFLRIREELGLAYYVGAQHFPGVLPGYFSFYVGTMPEKIGLVEKELLREAALLREGGLTEAELKRAKAKVVGQKKISRQDVGTIAMTSALDELYGVGFAHADSEDALYEAVTLDQVKAVAQKYLREDAVAVAIIGPEVELEPQSV